MSKYPKVAGGDIIAEVDAEDDYHSTICLQECKFSYSDGKEEKGYRFLYTDKAGELIDGRGTYKAQTMIYKPEQIKALSDQLMKNISG